MRVLHVARYCHPYAGGTEQVIASLARELSFDGVESRVLVSDLDRGGDGPAPETPVVEIPVAGSPRFPVPRGRFGELVRELRAADVVHLHDIRFLFETTALVRRGPVVLSTHGLLFHTDAAAVAKAVAWRGWIAPRLRRLDGVVAVSERDAGLCREAGVHGVVTIPNGVDTVEFAAVPDRRRERVGQLLYFGRLAPEKSVESLVGVLLARPAWRLTVVGAGEPAWQRRLDEAFAPVRERVTFTGPVGGAALRDHLLVADCVVLPSPAESFGLTLVEAMAAGVPVVAADAAAYREVAGASGVGFAAFSDGPAAAGVVERTVAGWSAPPARARAAEFSWPAAAAAYRKVYDEALAGRR